MLAVLMIPIISAQRQKAQTKQCANNLKQVALSFRLWEANSDKFTTQYPVGSGGCMESIATGNVAAVFLTMSNYLGSPNILICPTDTGRQPAANFTSGFENKNSSYFIGINAYEANPDCLLTGDDNFEISGAPVKPGVLNLQTNMPIAWTAKRHKFCGNIGLTDGSVQTVTSAQLPNMISQQWNSNYYLVTNRFPLAIP